MKFVDISMSPPQCRVLGHRIHHAIPGFALLACASLPLRLVGAMLIASDWQDRTVWLSDLVAHPDWRR